MLEPERPVPVTVAERTEKHIGPPPSLEAERRAKAEQARSRPGVPSRQMRSQQPPPAEPASRGPWMVVLALVVIGLVGGGLVMFRDEIFGHSRSAPTAPRSRP
jgi:hypothetical protein